MFEIAPNGIYNVLGFFFPGVEMSHKSIGMFILIVWLNFYVFGQQVISESLMIEVSEIDRPVDHINMHILDLHHYSLYATQSNGNLLCDIIISFDLRQ
jgi:hypothetical protein